MKKAIAMFILVMVSSMTHAATTLHVTKEQVCRPGYSASVRNVTTAMKRQVFEKAHIQYGTRGYVVDHRIPLSLGGSNAMDNLQLQTLEDSKAKDRVEDYLHRQVCSGGVTLRRAQMLMLNWRTVRVK